MVTRLGTSPARNKVPCCLRVPLGSQPGACTTDVPPCQLPSLGSGSLLFWKLNMRLSPVTRVDFTQLLAVTSVLGRCVASAWG